VIPLILAYIFFIRGLFIVKDNEVGIIVKKMFGDEMPQGQIIARNGEVGVQANTLMPGLHWLFPLIWRWEKVLVVHIKPDEVGIIEATDGDPLPKGALLAEEVDSNNFQDALQFFKNKGQKGPQVAVLRPGQYRINTHAFKINIDSATTIPEKKLGQIVALDGKPLPSGYIIAPRPGEKIPTKAELDNPNYKAEEPKPVDHKSWQDGQAFLNGGGFRGPQRDTLQPGRYYINPKLFKVTQDDISEVEPGFVAVIKSRVGPDLERKKPQGTTEKTDIITTETPKVERPDRPAKVPAIPGLEQPVHEESEVVLSIDKNSRGIWPEPVAPGSYNLNKLAFIPYLVPTSAITVDWAKNDQRIRDTNPSFQATAGMQKDEKNVFYKFSELRVTSKDAFILGVDVRIIIRVEAHNAPYVISRFGSVPNLIEQIVHPLIDSAFRNKAGEKKAMEFIQNRTEVQEEAKTHATEVFSKYHIEVQGLLISFIEAPAELLATQTLKEIALQQKEQFTEQAAAQEKRIEMEQKKATADKQGEVVQSEIKIGIEKNNAEALRRTAEGKRDSVRIEAEGTRDSFRIEAEGEAKAIRAVGAANAAAYQAQADAMGPERIAAIKMVEVIGEKGINITPTTLVVGGGKEGDINSPLLSTFLVTQINKTAQEGQQKTEKTKESAKNESENPKTEETTSSATTSKSKQNKITRKDKKNYEEE